MDLLIKNIGILFNGYKFIRDTSVYIENGLIKSIGKNERAEEVIDANGNFVMPGFIDSHTHIAFAGYRDFEIEWKIAGLSYEEIARRGGGILYTVEETRKASEERIIKEMEERAREMFMHGTTTIEVKSGYGLDKKNEIKLLEAINELKSNATIIPTYLAHAIPHGYDSEEYTGYVIEEILPEAGKLARFADVFCEKGYFNVEQSERILKEAKQHGMLPKIHADEFSCMGCSRLAAKLKAISADHLLMADDESLMEMKKAGVVATLLPATPFVLNEEYPNARKMLNMGLNVAIATDMNPNCYVGNMQFIIQLAVYKLKMPIVDALKAATINAAKALNLKDVGSIEYGKKADLIIFDAPSPNFIPYYIGKNLVKTVIKEGRVYSQ
ncbi:MAG: imidazolonepropionase [Thermoplasmata archaeon]|nr:MAG: imidazolonepropionase [Thermoplasmata archaeon]